MAKKEVEKIEELTKKSIVNDWLFRYTGLPLEDFGKYIILTNFQGYVKDFAKIVPLIAYEYNLEKGITEIVENKCNIVGEDRNMPSATYKKNAKDPGITIINFGMGSPNAATIIDLLTAINPKAILFLGKCGSLKDDHSGIKLGSFILPIAAIRSEGTSDDYLPKNVPALPAFMLQRVVSTSTRDNNCDYYTGVIYTTNRRVWEFDENFKKKLVETHAIAIDMETATVFSVGFANNIPTGALLLVSDQPMIANGIKTEKSDKIVTENFVEKQLKIGIEAINIIIRDGSSVKHLKFE
ncbi:MAG: AMP nucleosidase [Bacteroidales bacterium]|jgi:AMP nucleosidase|nr:AMP nucleosidase [Bacteroidales bacterium]